MIKELVRKGIPYAKIAEQLPPQGLRSIPGRITDRDAVREALAERYHIAEPERWFVEDPLLDGEMTWVVYRMWAADTQEALEKLRDAFPDSGVSFTVAD